MQRFYSMMNARFLLVTATLLAVLVERTARAGTIPAVQGTDASTASSDNAPSQAPALPYKVLTLPRPSSNGAFLNFSVVDQGRGPSTILMLHGFPDSAQVWRNQVPAFVKAGYRVIAPDLRGFGKTDKPQEVADYDFTELITDIIYILATLGAPPQLSAIVAHDYGTAIGTFLSALNGQFPGIPYHAQTYVMMSTGHLNYTAKYANINDNRVRMRQLAWYCLYFQAVGVAEQGVSDNNFEFYRTVFAPTTPAFIVNEQIAALSQPVGNNSLGSLTSAFNWYRSPTTGVTAEKFSIPSPAGPGEAIPDIPIPTLGIWGSQDPYVTKEWMQASARFVARNKYTLRVVNAGHWLPLEAPYTIMNLLMNFIPGAAKPAAG